MLVGFGRLFGNTSMQGHRLHSLDSRLIVIAERREEEPKVGIAVCVKDVAQHLKTTSPK